MIFSLLWLALGVSGEAPVAMWYAKIVDEKALPSSVGTRLTPAERNALGDGKPILPFREVTAGIRLPDGSLWVGTQGGLCFLAKDADHWRLFHSRRWLPNDRVQDLAVSSRGVVFVQTPSGMAKLFQQPKTLEQKMAEIH